MTTLGEIRDGIAANLATISGLRASSFAPDQINPPIAVVMPDKIRYDSAFGRGMDSYEFTILVFVGRQDERSAQSRLDDYCNPTGALSIKTAIESDKTLAAAAMDTRVVEMTGITPVIVGDTTYLTASFSVAVIAQ